jgi:hypothetical protein
MTGSPSSPLASAGTVDASQALGAAAARSAATIEVSFFDEQKRRRRETWRLSLTCFLIALGLGVAMSTIFGPLLLAFAGALLKLAAWGGCGHPCRALTHGIGSFARYEFETVAAAVGHGLHGDSSAIIIIREWAVVSIVLAPAMIAAAWAWVVIRRTLAQAALVDLTAPPARGRPGPRSRGSGSC